MFYGLSDGRFGHALGLRAKGQVGAIFAIYAIGFTALSAQILLLYLRAWKLRGPLRLNAREQFLTRAELSGWCLPLLVGIIALILALTLPEQLLPWSGWIYFSLAILVPLHRIWNRPRET
jgi:hypothetical protein